MSYDERMKGGLETYKKTHGTVLGDPGEIDPDSYNAHILRTVYNDVWARENMSMRERRLLVIGALAAQALEWPLRTHLACALQMGELGKDDVEEMKYLLNVYIGAPKATMFSQIVDPLLADLDQAK